MDMVLNTITNNMEKLIMKHKTPAKDINDAISLLRKGFTMKDVAEKYNVSVSTLYTWKANYNEGKMVDQIAKESSLIHTISFDLENDFYQELIKLSDHKVRTIPNQVKYLIKKELNKSLNNGFPF